jgi:hypothetical protein
LALKNLQQTQKTKDARARSTILKEQPKKPSNPNRRTSGNPKASTPEHQKGHAGSFKTEERTETLNRTDIQQEN